MTNDELKALRDKYPWAWVAEGQWKGEWRKDAAWHRDNPTRLKPKLPAYLPEPTEDMMNRAVYLGTGRVERPFLVEGFKGWCCRMQNSWSFIPYAADIDVKAHYCIDNNDLNAREVIALNRAEDDDAEIGRVLSEALRKSGEPCQAHNVSAMIALDDPELVAALVQAGWIPPGESQWLRLDECEVQIEDDCGNWIGINPSSSDNELLGFIGLLAEDGPVSVRVRRKK